VFTIFAKVEIMVGGGLAICFFCFLRGTSSQSICSRGLVSLRFSPHWLVSCFWMV